LYVVWGLLVCLFVVAFAIPWLYIIAQALLVLVLLATIADALILFANKEGIYAERNLAHKKLSNGDDNDVFISIKNNYSFVVHTSIIDEIPEQFQFREFIINKQLAASESQKIKYNLRPVLRGEFHFNDLIVFATTILGFVKRKFIFEQHHMLPCYPSFLKLRQFELLAISDRLTDIGIKKMRKIGQSTEFDNIREYVIGNDIRTINWKATARRGSLMVNHYRDERAQQVYCLIDMGRIMKMPFEELSLLDYSINASLVLSHISYIKHDKPGLITFSNKIHQTVTADRKGNQLFRIQEALYNANTQFEETNYEVLLNYVHTKLNQRSLLLLFTNFETINGLKRQLKYIKQLAKRHLVVVVLFENTELHDLLNKKATNTHDIYTQTIAKKFDYEKIQITYELQKLGIQCVYTKPQQLTVNTLNKYLELKARGMI
jgi:uncharacterized protein (DUF58 family)